MKRLSFVLAALVVLASRGVPAQPAPPARKPAAATSPYVVKSAASLADVEKTLQGPGGHGSTLVAPAPNVALEAVWRHEENKEAGGLESHDGKDHVFFITEGHGVFVLGGEMDSPKEISPGEWRAPKGKGGKEVTADKGDFVFIPHGVVHGRGKGGKFTMLLLSFWPGGVPAAVLAAPAVPPPPPPPPPPKTK